MKVLHTNDRIEIDYKDDVQLYVGLWFALMGVLALVLDKLVMRGDTTSLIVVAIGVIILGALAALARPRIQSTFQQDGSITITNSRPLFNKAAKVQTYHRGQVVNIELAKFLYDSMPVIRGEVLYMNTVDGARTKLGAQQHHAKHRLIPSEPLINMDELSSSLAVYVGVPLDNDPNKLRPLES